MKVLTKALIKKCEENAVKSGIFSYSSLMKEAGDKAYQIIKENYNLENKKIAVICGNGNNGGDGFVIAQNLKQNGFDVSVIIPFGKPLTDTAEYYFNLISGIEILNTFDKEYDIIIDAIFGIGLNRTLNDNAKELINKINSCNATRIAIDIPSGIESDSGEILGECVNAELSITFIALKPCYMLPPATDYCGKVIVADIGIVPNDYSYQTIDKPVFQKRKHNSHKGSFGTALLICGSYGMLGAAILSAKAAIRSGVGIAKCVICDKLYKAFTIALPEAVCIPVKQTPKGTLTSNINLKSIADKTNAILFGCGVKNTKYAKRLLIKLIKTAKIPLVIDADGINALSQNIKLLKRAKNDIILTPHPAEMARLCGKTVKEVESNRIDTAVNFCKENNCYLILKGANTIVCSKDGEIFFNMNGNPGMATGGSGDVLAGITVSLLAQGLPVMEALKAAVYVHSDAADKKSAILGESALMPSDIIEAL